MASNFYSQLVKGATSTASLVYGPVPTGQVAIIFGLSAANTLAAPVAATFYISRGLTSYNVIYQAVVPVGSSLVVAGNDQKIVLQAGDSLYVQSGSSAASLDIVCSVLVQS